MPPAPAVPTAQGGPGAPASAQPAVAWAAPAAVVDVKGKRTFLAGIAGALLLVGGILGILLGLLVAFVGGAFFANFEQFGGGFPEFPELEGADPGAVFGGVIAFIGFIVVAYSVAYLLAGIGVLRNSNWARVLGIVVGIISGLIWLSGVSNANLADAGGGAGSMIFAVVMLAIHAYIVLALLFFAAFADWRRSSSAANRRSIAARFFSRSASASGVEYSSAARRCRDGWTRGGSPACLR
jgi:hypothetical protein